MKKQRLAGLLIPSSAVLRGVNIRISFVGATVSANYPVTPGVYDPTYNGGWDAFLAKLAPRMQPQVYLPVISRHDT